MSDGWPVFLRRQEALSIHGELGSDESSDTSSSSDCFFSGFPMAFSSFSGHTVNIAFPRIPLNPSLLTLHVIHW